MFLLLMSLAIDSKFGFLKLETLVVNLCPGHSQDCVVVDKRGRLGTEDPTGYGSKPADLKIA